MSTTANSLVGRTISHYKIVRQIGAGGMGVVYEAEDSKLGRRVALKFLSEELQQDAPMLERFQREARAASALNHPGICTVHAIEQHEGQSFIVMELLEGEPLSARLGRQPMEVTWSRWSISNYLVSRRWSTTMWRSPRRGISSRRWSWKGHT